VLVCMCVCISVRMHIYLCLCIYKHRCVFVYMPDERACRLPEHILFVLPPPHTLTHALSPLLLRSLSALRSNVGHKIQRCVHRLPPSRNNWLPSSRTCLFQLSERMTCVGGAQSDEGESKLKNNENLPGKTGVSHSGFAKFAACLQSGAAQNRVSAAEKHTATRKSAVFRGFSLLALLVSFQRQPGNNKQWSSTK
jgi:hypothetical protein